MPGTKKRTEAGEKGGKEGEEGRGKKGEEERGGKRKKAWGPLLVVHPFLLFVEFG